AEWGDLRCAAAVAPTGCLGTAHRPASSRSGLALTGRYARCALSTYRHAVGDSMHCRSVGTTGQRLLAGTGPNLLRTCASSHAGTAQETRPLGTNLWAAGALRPFQEKATSAGRRPTPTQPDGCPDVQARARGWA